MRPIRPRSIARSIGRTLVLSVLVLLVLYPFSVLVTTSLKTQAETYDNAAGIPRHPTLLAYGEIFSRGRILLALGNSAVLTSVSVLGQVVAGSLCAYALSKMGFRRVRFFSLFFLAPMVYPIFSGIVPLYLLFTRLKLTNKLIGLIIIYIATGLPLAILLFTSFMKTIPYQLSEAALVEGASHGVIYLILILPLLAPAVVTTLIIASLSVWNDFFLPFIMISSQRKTTLPLWVFQYRTEHGVDWPKTSAAIMVLVIPIVIWYSLLQKQIIAGIVAGAVKG